MYSKSQLCVKIGNYPGAYPGFQVGGGAHLKKLRRAEGGAKICGVFRVKNHDFTPKNHIFPILRGGARWVRPPPPGSAPAILPQILTRLLVLGKEMF